MSAATHSVALITGCGKKIGVGAGIARMFAATCVAVAVTDAPRAGARNSLQKSGDLDESWGGLDALVAEIRERDGVAAAMVGDVRSEAEAQRMVQETIDLWGRLDLLVNNAAAPHGREFGEIEEVPVDAWDEVIAVNARGPFLVSRAPLPAMKRQGWGRTINISSISGPVVDRLARIGP
jgi:NAD(P)-dependent dehydrogenase (short-subunit alcohol dehydrogenase family)